MKKFIKMTLKKKKYKFNVDFYLDELSSVPLIHGLLFAKLRLKSNRKSKLVSPREEIEDHSVKWLKKFNFTCKMTANALNGCLDSCFLRVSIRKEVNGGITYQKLGFVDVDLAEFAGCGLTSKMYLLEGYKDTKTHRQDNSTLKVQVDCNLIKGDPLFKRPSKSNSSFYISSINSEASSKENTIVNRSDKDNVLNFNQNKVLAKDKNNFENTLTRENGFKKTFGQSILEFNDQATSSQIGITLAEDCSAGSLSSGSGSLPYIKSDQKIVLPNVVTLNKNTSDNQIINLIENQKQFESNSQSENSSSTSSKVSDGYGSLPSHSRQNSGETNLIRNASLIDSSLKFFNQNDQPNRSISSRSTNTLNSHQTMPSLNQQFNTLQPNQQLKYNNSFANMSLNLSLNELADSKIDLKTRVNCEQLIDELIETNLNKNENDLSINDNEVGLQLFVAKDGTTKLGSRSSNTKIKKPNKTIKNVNSYSSVASFASQSNIKKNEIETKKT